MQRKRNVPGGDEAVQRQALFQLPQGHAHVDQPILRRGRPLVSGRKELQFGIRRFQGNKKNVRRIQEELFLA